MKLEFGKKIYSVRESYLIFYHGLRTIKYTRIARKKGELSRQSIERLMLAVTEVNGCAACAWAHTKAALESGMSGEEIRSMLQGEVEQVPVDDMAAVMFAQHYADTRGNPSRAAWQRVVDEYGLSKAWGILGAIRMIMIGNAYGIAGGALSNRLRGQPDPQSGLLYELAMIASVSVVLPVALLHAALSNLLDKPLIHFSPLATTTQPA